MPSPHRPFAAFPASLFVPSAVSLIFACPRSAQLVKRASRQIVEKYYQRLTLDFHTNKRIVAEIATVPSKRLRNKIAGFTTHLMKRIQTGAVRGISLKLLEEERERRMDRLPEKSEIDTSSIQIDKDTNDLLNSLNFGKIDGIDVKDDLDYIERRRRGPRRPRGDRK